MNNDKLLLQFKTIAKIGNPFDVVLALKRMNKEYKKSEFYKQTHLNIYKAYEIFTKMMVPSTILKVEDVLEYGSISSYINEMLEEVDLGFLFNKFIYGINWDLVIEYLQKLMPQITTEELKGLGEELKKTIEQFKK